MNQVNFQSGKFYHLFNRGNNKQAIFFDEKNYLYFMDLVKKHLLPIAKIYAYCLLNNHFHFLIQLKDEELPEKFKNGKSKLHQPISNLFNAYTKAINKMYNRTGSLFQEHIKRKEINSLEYLRQVIIYIHLNPFNHGISSNFKSYPYSSYRGIISTKQTLLQREEVIEMFEDVANFKYVHQNQRVNEEVLNQIIVEDD